MTRTSLIALLAAMGVTAAPALALADCHTPLAEGTVAADYGPPPPAEEDAAAAGDEDDEDTELAELDGGDEEIDAPEDSAILPSAEGHLESEAPTMEIDCEAQPELCAGEPLQMESVGPTLSEGDDIETTEVENPEGDPVVAEPQC